MAPQQPSVEPHYRIGSVSRLTGLSGHVLRMWERRYRVVAPTRSEGGNRLYSEADVAKLTLLKRLVDAGDAIGTLAPLSLDQLEARLAHLEAARSGRSAGGGGDILELVVVGRQLAAELTAVADAFPEFDVRAVFDSAAELLREARSLRADVLVVDRPTVQPDTAQHVTELLGAMEARHAFVVYRFGSSAAVRRLQSGLVTPIRGPLDLYGLRDRCRALGLTAGPIGGPSAELGETLPRRYFTDAELERAAAVSTGVQCECPTHLVRLITGIAAFEAYSGECESRNARDAALHRYLHATTARARELMELALERVLEVEGVTLT